MATNISEWTPNVHYQLGDTLTPPDKITEAVILALKDFCSRTLLWNSSLARVSVVANTSEYALSHASGDIISIARVLFKKTGEDDDQFSVLTPTSIFFEDEHTSGAWEHQTGTTPDRFYIGNDKSLHLIPIPTEASTDGLLINAYIKPFTDATTVEDFFFDDHEDTITVGAVSKLLSEANTPRTDVVRGYQLHLDFVRRCNEVLGVMFTGYTNKQTRVRFRRFV